MAYSTEEIRALKTKIDAALASRRLDAWQTKFLTDISARIAKYGTETRLSAKQIDKISEITGPEIRRGNTTNVRAISAARRSPPRRRKKRSALAWEGRWFARRFVRDLAIAAALIVGAGVYAAIQDGSFSITGSPIASKTVSGQRFSVTDGDTIRVYGDSKGTRLVGFNTPETFRARCDRELELGNRATKRLKELVASSRVELRKVPCACEPGTEGTDACNFGRSCGILLTDGRDVGQILISEGLAVPFSCGPTSCPPLPRPWCD